MNAGDCQECLASVVEYGCRPEFSEQMQIARELFSLATGKVNDDDPFYESRMGCFQEFFTFDYRLADVFSGATVFELFLLNAQADLPKEKIFAFEQLRSGQHSLFQVLKSKLDQIHVVNLISGRQFSVCALPNYRFEGFEPQTIFDGRLFSFGGQNFFSGSFIFHPKEVIGLVLKLVKAFLRNVEFCSADNELDWRKELNRRDELLAEVAERKREAELSEKKRAIDLLNVTKQLVNVSRTVSNPNLVMALGRKIEVSAFIPESPLVDVESFLQKLAYCHLRSHRYKHIDPPKVYDLESEHFYAPGNGKSPKVGPAQSAESAEFVPLKAAAS